MADERLLAVITSNSSQSVQKSCCVIATSSSMIRTFGFVIFVFPVTDQNRTGGFLKLHLRQLPFRRMPGFLERPRAKTVATRVPTRAPRETDELQGKTPARAVDEGARVHTSGHKGVRACAQV